MQNDDNELDENAKEVRQRRWREASGAVFLAMAFMLLLVLIVAS